MIYSGNMNAEVLILFLGQLTKTKERKTFLILDNLRVHHSAAVKDWLVGREEKIELFFLPAYSPERNPDEYLNCDLKQGLSAKPAPKTKEKLQENVENHMNMLAENSERVRKYFMHKDIQYAA